MNIIVIIADTYRYDNLFARADMPVRTPELDHFAQQSISLDRLYTSSFPTIPHRTDFTTGRYGWPWYPWQDRRISSPNHIPILLRQAGYVSQLLGDCPHLMRAGFFEGFDGAYTLRGQEGDTYFLRMNHMIEETMPPEKTRTGHHFQDRNLPDLHKWTNRYWKSEADTFPPRTAALAVEWLEENYRQDPFFLWVDFFDPHEPWDPPEYMVKRYDPDYDGIPMIHPNYGKADDLTSAELRNLRAHYCAEAELVDRWIGRILQKIDDLDLWQNSIVVFMSDHGMALGEHNSTGKSNINTDDDRFWPLYPEIAHIPFMVSAPGLQGGTTVDALLQPVDILPTLLDLGGLTLIPDEPFHGRSFAPMLRGEEQEPLHDFIVTASYLRIKEGAIPENVMTPMLYTNRWAYTPIGHNRARELYDLEADPNAAQNVAFDYPGVVEDLHGKIVGWLTEMNAPLELLKVLE
ncbi:sulfatase-like hydrolase/transferase [Chloroflexi bacterium TSY]|nr:sulfatase-like hydrolase/transferase [Chloroflexi bacterium TSY]